MKRIGFGDSCDPRTQSDYRGEAGCGPRVRLAQYHQDASRRPRDCGHTSRSPVAGSYARTCTIGSCSLFLSKSPVQHRRLSACGWRMAGGRDSRGRCKAAAPIAASGERLFHPLGEHHFGVVEVGRQAGIQVQPDNLYLSLIAESRAVCVTLGLDARDSLGNRHGMRVPFAS